MASKEETNPQRPQNSDHVSESGPYDKRKRQPEPYNHNSQHGRVPHAFLINDELYEPEKDFSSKDLDNQYFKGPDEGRGAYASVCVLDPILTIEHRDREYHIAVNFHLETTILGYSTQKSIDHEWFFSDVTLQYCSKFDKEKLIMEPASDPTSAFAVTRSSNMTINGSVGVTAAQVPSANVSLGITKSRDLSVEYKMKTWSVSAHQVAQPVNAPSTDRPRSTIEYLCKMIRGNDNISYPQNDSYRRMSWEEPPSPTNEEYPRYQWFWVGNQEETEILTPDLRHTVKRHIVVKRVIKDADFPINNVDSSSKLQKHQRRGKRLRKGEPAPSDLKTQRSERVRRHRRSSAARGKGLQMPTLEDLLNFSFCVQIRIKKKHGRLHRFFTISKSNVKGSILTPYYVQKFDIGVKAEAIPDVDIPPDGPENTESIPATLAKIKEENSGDYDKLHGQNLTQVWNSTQEEIILGQNAYRRQSHRPYVRSHMVAPEMGPSWDDHIMASDILPAPASLRPQRVFNWQAENRRRQAAQEQVRKEVEHVELLARMERDRERERSRHEPVEVVDMNASSGRAMHEARERAERQFVYDRRMNERGMEVRQLEDRGGRRNTQFRLG